MARVALIGLLLAACLAGQVVVCDRCHVTSTVEWGLSKHRTASIGCVNCHGQSTGHVLDEQNGVKPDRIPRGVALAALCIECHQNGCPKTAKTTDCKTCHHFHALLDPNRDASGDRRAEELAQRVADFRSRMEAADKAFALRDWQTAFSAYRTALAINPANEGARSRAIFAWRKANLVLPGFQNSSEIEGATGLPKTLRLESAGIELVLMPGGDFDFGKPAQTVHLQPFYISRRELSQVQWTIVMGSNPSRRQGATLPVERVSFNDAVGLVAKLNAITAGFRLPSEEEWEFAAQHGIQTGNISEWCSSKVLRGGSYGIPVEWTRITDRHSARPDQRLPFNGVRVVFSPPSPMN